MLARDLVAFGPPPPNPAARDASVHLALAERYLESLRVGRGGGDRPEARLEIRGLRGGEAVRVRLEHADGTIRATLASDDVARARSLSRRVQDELAAAGVEAFTVEVEP